MVTDCISAHTLSFMTSNFSHIQNSYTKYSGFLQFLILCSRATQSGVFKNDGRSHVQITERSTAKLASEHCVVHLFSTSVPDIEHFETSLYKASTLHARSPQFLS